MKSGTNFGGPGQFTRSVENGILRGIKTNPANLVIVMKPLILLASIVTAALAQAQSLRFYYGSVADDHAVGLGLQGPTNRWATLERLAYFSQTWQSVGDVWLGASGYGTTTLTNGLDGNFYGIYRARYTNSAPVSTLAYSTNIFGAVAGYVPAGTSLLGNPFSGPLTNSYVSQVFRPPIDSLDLYAYRGGSFVSLGECSSDFWLLDGVLQPLEGMAVVNNGTNPVHYVVSGILSSNVFSKGLVSGLNLLVAPLFRLPAPDSNAVARAYPQEFERVDLLTAGLLGGLSHFPAPTSWSVTPTVLSRLTSHTGTNLYTGFKLNQFGTNWLTVSNTPVSIPLNLAEGFWLSLPTNRTWDVPARMFYP